MVWYFVLIGIATAVAIKLLIPYIRKRYIDVEIKTCVICGKKYRQNGPCPACSGR